MLLILQRAGRGKIERNAAKSQWLKESLPFAWKLAIFLAAWPNKVIKDGL